MNWVNSHSGFVTAPLTLSWVVLTTREAPYVCVSVKQGYSSQVRMKVIRSKNGPKSEFPQCKTLSSSNSSSVKHKAMKFACSIGFSAMVDQMVWPPSLSRDCKWLHVSKCTHSLMAGLRLEGSLVIIVCPMQFMALDRYKITWVFVRVCVCPQNVSSTIATTIFVRSSWNLERGSEM